MNSGPDTCDFCGGWPARPSLTGHRYCHSCYTQSIEGPPHGTYQFVPTEAIPDGPIGTEARVCQDIAARQAKGLAKYGVTVENNPLSLKEWLQHALEECYDQAIYLKRAIEELEK
jgi:hypothetical protein